MAFLPLDAVHSAAYAMACTCLSRSAVVWKRLNLSSDFLAGSLFMKICCFRPVPCFILDTIQDRAVITVERQQGIVCELSNDVIFNDLERR